VHCRLQWAVGQSKNSGGVLPSYRRNRLAGAASVTLLQHNRFPPKSKQHQSGRDLASQRRYAAAHDRIISPQGSTPHHTPSLRSWFPPQRPDHVTITAFSSELDRHGQRCRDLTTQQQQTQTGASNSELRGIIDDANGNYCCSGTLGALVQRSGTQYI